MRSQSNFRVTGLFLLLIAVLLAGTLVSYRATLRVGESERWVAHTYDVMSAIDSLTLKLERTQNAADDYLSTGNRSFLDLYRDTVVQIEPAVDSLRMLTADNPDQQRTAKAIERDSQTFQSTLDMVVTSRTNGNVASLTGEQLRSALQNLYAMRLRETELLKGRTEEAALNLRTTRIGLLTGAFIGSLLLAIAGYFVIRDHEQRTQIRESQLRLADIVDSSDDAIIGKRLDGTITSWNAGAYRLYGYTAGEMVGRSIYDIVPLDRHEELRRILERLGRGERIDHLETSRIRRDGAEVEVELTVSPIKDRDGTILGASAIGRDITRRKQLERSLHQLSVRILRAQDEERRRIARDIHDTTVQKLALLSMNLAQLKPHANSGANLIENSQKLAKECVQELRTLSYVLHPPMLDELGLGSALRIYVEGIAQRSGVAIDTEVDPAVPRLRHEAEMALFRVAQESLSNVLRHSGSKTARIKLTSNNGVEMTISDEGKGFTKQMQPDLSAPVGVGIAGMNERISQLGGVLTIDSTPSGTTVTAHLPVERNAGA